MCLYWDLRRSRSPPFFPPSTLLSHSCLGWFILPLRFLNWTTTKLVFAWINCNLDMTLKMSLSFQLWPKFILALSLEVLFELLNLKLLALDFWLSRSCFDSRSNRSNQCNSRIPCSVVVWKEKLNSSLEMSDPVVINSAQKWLKRVDGGRDRGDLDPRSSQ